MHTKHLMTTLAACALLSIGGAGSLHAQIPNWGMLYLSDGGVWTTDMIGEQPGLGRTTHIPVILVPLKLIFDGGLFTFDPSAKQPPHDSPLAFVLKSPLFQPAHFPKHPETLGEANHTQYLDAYQRANFWNIVTGGSTDPAAPVKNDFHILLNAPIVIPRTLNVSFSDGFISFNDAGKPKGNLNWAFFHDRLGSLLELSPSGALTIFLISDTIFYNFDNGGETATAGGFHSHINGQTFIASGFTFDKNDVVPLGHELAEWLVDPFGTSQAPGWRAPVSGNCVHHMEVGDPNHGNFFKVTIGDDTFTLEDLSFLSWFARTQPSTAINGFRTFQGLSTPNVPCQ